MFLYASFRSNFQIFANKPASNKLYENSLAVDMVNFGSKKSNTASLREKPFGEDRFRTGRILDG